MLNRVANETTIHGIKEAWEANRSGRIFYFLVFVVCFILMVLQLRGLFSSYINEEVGTRVRSSTKSNTSKPHAFYYCNRNWLPKVEALDRFELYGIRSNADILYRNCIHKGDRFSLNTGSRDPLDLDHFGFNRSREFHNLKSKMYLLHAGHMTNLSASSFSDYVGEQDNCKPYIEYWKTILNQEIINSVVTPLDDRRQQASYHRKKRPVIDASEKPFIVHLLAERINPFLKYLGGKSVEGFIKKNFLNVSLGEFITDQSYGRQDVYYNSTSTIMADAVDSRNDIDIDNERDINSEIGMLEPDRDKLDKVNHSDRRRTDFDIESVYGQRINAIRLAASLDGVCWEHANDRQTSGRNMARHVIIHLGGLIHQMRRLIGLEMYDLGDMDTYLVKNAIKFFDAVGGRHHTDLAVSIPSHMGLYFNQKVRVDSGNPLVNVRFWRKNSIGLNRKAERCMGGSWTDLDQAHCNQQQAMVESKLPCETYLPASASYPETLVTNRTCIYDHTELFSDIVRGGEPYRLSHLEQADRELYREWRILDDSLAQRVSDLLAKFNPMRLSNDSRADVIRRLTRSNPRCPGPCSKITYGNQISYPVPSQEDLKECHLALANFLTPLLDYYYVIPSHMRDGSRETVSGKPAIRNMLSNVYTIISRQYGSDVPYCSIIEYDETADKEQVSEEYFLYSWSDLAANLGGTLGLWIGASVISVVQLTYISCLERLLKTMSYKGMFWQRKPKPGSSGPVPLTGKLRNPSKKVLPV